MQDPSSGGPKKLFQFEAHIHQAAFPLDLENDRISGLHPAQGRPERFHGIDVDFIQLMNDVSCLEASVGQNQIGSTPQLGLRKETDLALLKIDDKDLPTLQLLSQQRPQVGQLVFAIGSPEGLQNSVTMGVISAVARQADPGKPMTYIQTDAQINPGNSGGPLVDMNGAVVGINTFILSEGGGSEGLGFAIPARIVEFVYHSLQKYGHLSTVKVLQGRQAPAISCWCGAKPSKGLDSRRGRNAFDTVNYQASQALTRVRFRDITPLSIKSGSTPARSLIR